MMDGSASVRLTSMAHGGGCGCKLSPAVLRDILSSVPAATAFPDLLVGRETSDDAAVWRLDEGRALVATTDFFTPIVDDPFDFGRIAAANALSDVYAMGGTPILALALVGMPVATLPAATMRAILEGGAALCAEAGVPVAGGHSIDTPEPLYGLVALGLVDPRQVLRNAGARPGDALVLTKGLGIGIFSAALKAGVLDASGLATMVSSATTLNRAGPRLAGIVHAATDVTGFGLVGHLLEMCRASHVAARLWLDHVPVLPGAVPLAMRGVATGASARNWASDAADVHLPAELAGWWRTMLCDPQTSGGLLLACAPDHAERVIGIAREEGSGLAAVIGRVEEGAARIIVEPARKRAVRS